MVRGGVTFGHVWLGLMEFGHGPSWESHDGPYSRKPSGPGR